MHVRSNENLVGPLAASGVFLQTSVSEDPAAIVTIHTELTCLFGIPRRKFTVAVRCRPPRRGGLGAVC